MIEIPIKFLYLRSWMTAQPKKTEELKYIDYRYIIIMIRNFKRKMANDIYHGTTSSYARKLPRALHKKARRLLDQINAATKVETLKVPPGNHLEKLTGNLNGHWSIRINIQWRILFKWEDAYAVDVDIVDYH
jgi:proteic killer suppression protein